jgi:hypothetical protein
MYKKYIFYVKIKIFFLYIALLIKGKGQMKTVTNPSFLSLLADQSFEETYCDN